MKNPRSLRALSVLAILIVSAWNYADSSEVDIDYSHNVVGTGTVMTDFKLGSDENTEATGKVRGTGGVVNKYIFQSNNSDNVTIEDQFLFSKTIEPHEITIDDYPRMTKSPDRFRMLGTTWAGKINLSSNSEHLNKTPL